MKKKTIGIIGTNGLPGKYGGWDQLVIHLTDNLKEKFSFIVYTGYSDAVPGLTEYNKAKIKVMPFKANGMQSIPFDITSMIHAIFYCDVLFICGTSGCVFLPLIKLLGKKIVLNPDGQEWKRDKWSKPVQWFLKISESLGVRYATDVIADNVKIGEYLKAEYDKQSSLIEYGGDHVLNVNLKEETAKSYGILKGKYAFKVCRIVPENNIDLILEAFSCTPNIKLIIIGNWNFSEFGRKLREIYKRFDNISMLDPIYEQETLDELRSNCGIYIHGHSVGGTNPSLVEAMSLGLCVVSYDVEYNIETTEGKAMYFKNADDLKQILNRFIMDELDIFKYKDTMKEIADRRYTWSIITEKYSRVFQNNKL